MFSVNLVVYSQGNVFFNIGAAIPLSDFASADLDNDNAGGAATGFILGLQYVYPILDNGLGLFGGADFVYNGLKKEYKDDMMDEIDPLNILDDEYSFYNYLNVPLSAGLNYTYNGNKDLSIYANAGITANFLKVTDYVVKAGSFEATESFETSFNVGFKLGAGAVLNKKITFSVTYLGLGNHDLVGTLRTGNLSTDVDDEQKVDLITLAVGFKF